MRQAYTFDWCMFDRTPDANKNLVVVGDLGCAACRANDPQAWEKMRVRALMPFHCVIG